MKQAYFRRQVSFLLAAFLAAITAIAPAAAQAPPAQPQPDAAQSQPAKPALPPDVADSITRLTSAIETAEKAIQHLAELEEELGGLRVDVETILADSTQTAETLRPELVAVKSQIEKLGPPPSKDGPPEAPGLATERARLMALAAGLDSAIKSTELTWVRARQLIEKITVLRHSLFTKNLMERRPSPLLPELWRDLVSKSPAVGHRISYLAEDWLHWANVKRQQVGLLLAAALILFVTLKYAIARLTDRRRVASEPPLPSFFDRARSVAWVAPLRAQHGLRAPPHRPAAAPLHAEGRKCARRNRRRRIGCGRRPTHLSTRPALAQAAAVADRARHPWAGAARLRGARTLPGPAGGD